MKVVTKSHLKNDTDIHRLVIGFLRVPWCLRGGGVPGEPEGFRPGRLGNLKEDLGNHHPGPLRILLFKTGIIKWDPFWGDQTMQIYGDFEGIPPYSALFGVVSYNDP